MLIIIEGLQGTGKTFLCDQVKRLRHVHCYDLDDISIEAYKRTGGQRKKWDALENKMINGLIKKYKNEILVLVAVGLEVDVEPQPTTYFIRIKDIDHTYRRFMDRELMKVARHQKQIGRIIKSSDARKVLTDIDAVVQEWVGFMSFAEYKQRYEQKLAEARERGDHIRTQDQIYREIKQLSDLFDA